MLAHAGQMIRRQAAGSGPRITPVLSSITPPTRPGTVLLEGEPFTGTGIKFGSTQGKIWYASTAAFVGATLIECTVTDWTDTTFEATAPPPGAVGYDGYVIVQHSNGRTSVGIPAEVWDRLPDLTFEDAEHRWPDAIFSASGGTAAYVTDVTLPGRSHSFQTACDGTAGAGAYGKDETDWPGHDKVFSQAQLYLISATMAAGDAYVQLTQDVNEVCSFLFARGGSGEILSRSNVHGVYVNGPELSTGQWYTIEQLYEKSAPGESNGVGQAWLDGTPLYDPIITVGADEDQTGNRRLGIYSSVSAGTVLELRWGDVFTWGRA